MSWWACLRASACSLNCSMSGTAPRVRPPCRFRNTFRSRAMPKALLNRKTGKQRPFFTALLLLQPACFGNREKRLQPLRQVVKQRPSFPVRAPAAVESWSPRRLRSTKPVFASATSVNERDSQPGCFHTCLPPGAGGFVPLGRTARPIDLPAEIHAQVLIEPPVVRLEVLFQPPPGGRIYPRIPILALRAHLEHRGFGFPIRQTEIVLDNLQRLQCILVEVLAL